MTNEQRIQEALAEIAAFGDADGVHHKQWVLDQVVRILTDCKVGNHKRIPSDEYHKWLRIFAEGENGPHTHQWDIGIAP